jgi:peptidoglycan hydrolase FlgJ
MLAAGDSLAVGLTDAQALKGRAASGDRESIRDAARQFESLMVAQMLKSMRQTRFSDEDDPMNGGDTLKLYRELLDQQWAAKMSKGRGLGFADMLVKHLERQAGFPAEAGGNLPTPSLVPERVLPARGEGAGMAASPLTASQTAISSPACGGGREGESCRKQSLLTNPSSVPAALEPRAGDRKQQFLEAMRPHAEAAAAATGLPARFILAQAALESGWGGREIRGNDGQSSHNLFGIKAGPGWRGESTETATTEYRQGLDVKQSQRFRAYPDYTAAFADYADLLKSRYGGALGAGDDAEAFARALAAGGYATDPAYAGKLKAVIASVAVAGV